MRDNTLTIAYATLFIGIGLLAITFITAFIFLVNNPPITGSSDLVNSFGDSLAPLIEASIRIMFLGVMGWIASALTARGVQLLTQIKRLTEAQSIPRPPEKTKGNRKTGKS